MAQTAPPIADAPLPRPGRFSPHSRAARAPRLTAVDTLWMGLLALLAFALSLLLSHTGARAVVSACLSAASVKLLYLYGWRARDRAAGIIAALLAATSLPFLVHGITTPLDALFVVLSLAALFSYLAGSSLLALLIAGLATAARPDAVLLGLTLAILALAQKRRRAILGAVVFAVAATLCYIARYDLGHHTPHISSAFKPWLFTWAVASGMAFVSWLLVPFCAELGEPARRARWMPLLLWAIVYLAVESVLRVTGRAGIVFGLAPLWFALAGGGLSRLLPAVTGEVPLPWARYGLATLATLGILGIRLYADMTVSKPHPRTHTVPVALVPAHPAVTVPLVVPAHTSTSTKPTPIPAKPAPTPAKSAPPTHPAMITAKPAPPAKATPAAKPTPSPPTYHTWHRYTHYYRSGYHYWRRR